MSQKGAQGISAEICVLSERWLSFALSHTAKERFIMMRSMFSGVSGLKGHQTRMDVIGNNI
ncbi:flagellar basal body protein, partial [Selenomonas sp. oral taxon 138]|uniref:flagellar basal body protein n=1 Tax=Selenomonas sp. oral taxon 138 TaxID=712532 RepID=UPI0002A44A92